MSWTRESLTARSTLMKLAEGCGGSGKAPLAAGVTVPVGRDALAWPRYIPLMTGSPTGEGLTAWLSPPPLAMGQKPRPHLAVAWSSASSELVGPQQVSFRGVQRRAPVRKKLSLCIPRGTEGGVMSRVLPLLLPPVFGVDRHLFGSSVPSLEDLAHPLLGPLHRLNCLNHELRDGPRLIILTYIELEVAAMLRSSVVGSPKGFHTGFPSFQLGTSPLGAGGLADPEHSSWPSTEPRNSTSSTGR
ncbi:hypothetical protein Cgig2_021278 [Carnegiea gigantea]|uniref:Uncharacterized protein n=1 Tax=Carnegiea gigantea TaxID=171969 RepID=A0A9Q1GJP9_9CARY|nr:hypothetical protein Cgig2_021278 [Carnegiea gigantea]